MQAMSDTSSIEAEPVHPLQKATSKMLSRITATEHGNGHGSTKSPLPFSRSQSFQEAFGVPTWARSSSSLQAEDKTAQLMMRMDRLAEGQQRLESQLDMHTGILRDMSHSLKRSTSHESSHRRKSSSAAASPYPRIRKVATIETEDAQEEDNRHQQNGSKNGCSPPASPSGSPQFGVPLRSSLRVRPSPESPVRHIESLPAVEPETRSSDEEERGSETTAERRKPQGEAFPCVRASTIMARSSYNPTTEYDSMDMASHVLTSDEKSNDLGVHLSSTWPRVKLREEIHSAIESSWRSGSIQMRVSSSQEAGHLARESFIRFQNVITMNDSHVGELPPKWIMLPNSKKRVFIDILSVGFLFYDLLATPVILAWDVRMTTPILSVAISVALFWSLDIAANFHTAFYYKGETITDPAVIRKNYMQRLFPLDVLLVMFDWINVGVFFAQASADPQLEEVIRMSRLLRLAKVVRTVRLADLFFRIKDRFKFRATSSLIFEVAGPLLLILWINHLLTCLWYAVSQYLPSDTTYTWLDKPIGEDGPLYRDAGLRYQYFTAYHWSITQMTPGSMQVVPMNTVERIVNILCLVFGLFFFSTIISTLSAKSMQWRLARQETTNNLTKLRRFLVQMKVRAPLGIRIERHIGEAMLWQKPLTTKDVHILQLLSMSLKIDLQIELSWRPMLVHPFFKLAAQVDVLVMKAMCCEATDWQVLAPYENLFLAGNAAKHAHFILTGELTYTQEPLTSKELAHSETSVPVETWLCEAALWTHWTHVGTIESHAACQVLILEPSAAIKALSKGTVLFPMVCEYVRIFHMRLCTSVPPKRPWPNDLRVIDTEFDELVLMMNPEIRTFASLLALYELKETKAKSPFTYMQLSSKIIDELQDEVASGECVLVSTPTGEVHRLSVVCALHLTDQDGKVLAQLGKLRGKHRQLAASGQGCQVQAQCRLPGLKQAAGEGFEEALERLLRGRLPQFADLVEVSNHERKVEIKKSPHFGILTRYIRNVCYGTCNTTSILFHVNRVSLRSQGLTCAATSDTSLKRLSVVSATSGRHSTGNHSNGGVNGLGIDNLEIWVIDDDDDTFFYAWVSQEDFDSLTTHQQKLSSMLCNLDLQDFPSTSTGNERPIVLTMDI